MIRSMYSAISGLRNHQIMMDVVGNNIANVNTVGFKSSTVLFQDVLSQQLRGAGAPQALSGGTNPAQVGLGSMVASIPVNLAQGALQRTGRATDLAIQGDGLFAVDMGGQRLYTRAGSFSVDAEGRLVTQEGGFVLGWNAVDGQVNSNGATGPVVIPVGSVIPPVETTTVNLSGNLPATAVESDQVVLSVDVYNAQGTPTTVRMVFEKTATANEWTVTANDGTADIGTATVTFDPATGMPTAPVSLSFTPAGFSAPVTADLGVLTNFGDFSSVAVESQDGATAGSLQSFSVSQEGLIVGSYSNGKTQEIGQVAIASFTNPEGLEKVGGSMYRATVNSGLEQIGVAGDGGRGLLSMGTVEMSNVDLAQEFTNLIVAQRGFQANSRVITTSDELLQEVVNLKR